MGLRGVVVGPRRDPHGVTGIVRENADEAGPGPEGDGEGGDESSIAACAA